jgi:hypothetical protein
MSQDRRGCFETGLKAIAVLMAIVLILSIPLALGARSFGRVLFRPAILTEVLRQSILSSPVLEDAVQENQLSREFFGLISDGEDEIGRYFEYLSPGERDEIFRALLPQDWLENQFAQLLLDFFHWLDDDRAYPQLALEVAPLKAKLLRGGITTFVDVIVDSWPSCKPDQVDRMQQSFFERGVLPQELCEPPEPMRSRVVDLASIGFEEQVRLLPGTIPLIEPDAAPEDMLALKEQLRFYRAITLWGWMLPLSLLGLIMAFAIRQWRDFGRWWGLPLLLGGVGTFFLAMLLGAGREDLVSTWAGSVAPGTIFQDLVRDILEALYTAGLRPLWLQSAVIIALALLLWWISRRSRSKGSSAPAESPRTQQVDTKILEPEIPDLEDEETGEPPSGIFG